MGPELPIPDELLGEKSALIEYINRNVVGHLVPIQTPYGLRPLIYADYTASGRLLNFIEEYLNKVVHQTYGNVHTSTSWVGLQTSFFRHEARAIIHRCLGCIEDDCVIFCGSGSTAAVNKLVNIMRLTNWGLQKSTFRKNRWGSISCTVCQMSFSTQGLYLNHLQTPVHKINVDSDPLRHTSDDLKPIVFVSIYEHHSNLLPWREVAEQMVTIHENDRGELDLQELREQLEKYRKHPGFRKLFEQVASPFHGFEQPHKGALSLVAVDQSEKPFAFRLIFLSSWPH